MTNSTWASRRGSPAGKSPLPFRLRLRDRKAGAGDSGPYFPFSSGSTRVISLSMASNAADLSPPSCNASRNALSLSERLRVPAKVVRQNDRAMPMGNHLELKMRQFFRAQTPSVRLPGTVKETLRIQPVDNADRLGLGNALVRPRKRTATEINVPGLSGAASVSHRGWSIPAADRRRPTSTRGKGTSCYASEYHRSS